MALLSSTSHCIPFLFSQNPNPKPFSVSSLHFQPSLSPHTLRFPYIRFIASAAGDADKASANISYEWGESSEPEPEASSSPKLPDVDPPKDEDEWGGVSARADTGGVIDAGNGTPATPSEAPVDGKLYGLKRALLDTVFGTELGFRAGSKVLVY